MVLSTMIDIFVAEKCNILTLVKKKKRKKSTYERNMQGSNIIQDETT